MKSLAIEREFGSGGREIGKKVAEKAGISCYDGSLIAQVAEAKGVSLDMLKKYDEKEQEVSCTISGFWQVTTITAIIHRHLNCTMSCRKQ